MKPLFYVLNGFGLFCPDFIIGIGWAFPQYEQRYIFCVRFGMAFAMLPTFILIFGLLFFRSKLFSLIQTLSRVTKRDIYSKKLTKVCIYCTVALEMNILYPFL
eukprot:TRINITY_DN2286_c0_g1_i5.p1 TRINITY_DN2286_c0_g1~~TRINITY_DN2286_c0_g1_i5.p1  ORF type:complete len:103 (+),score=5.96 TRINITY_DN2286_c0_g1_i5:430-738(+)